MHESPTALGQLGAHDPTIEPYHLQSHNELRR